MRIFGLTILSPSSVPPVANTAPAPSPSANPAALDTTSDDDLIQQYMLVQIEVMGQRIQWYLEQLQGLETLAIVATGGIWSFLLGREYSPAADYLAWMPFGITALFAVKSRLFTKTIDEAFNYLSRLETACKLPSRIGWVDYFRSTSSRFKRRWRKYFWAILLSANAVAAAFLPLQDLLQPAS